MRNNIIIVLVIYFMENKAAAADFSQDGDQLASSSAGVNESNGMPQSALPSSRSPHPSMVLAPYIRHRNQVFSKGILAKHMRSRTGSKAFEEFAFANKNINVLNDCDKPPMAKEQSMPPPRLMTIHVKNRVIQAQVRNSQTTVVDNQLAIDYSSQNQRSQVAQGKKNAAVGVNVEAMSPQTMFLSTKGQSPGLEGINLNLNDLEQN